MEYLALLLHLISLSMDEIYMFLPGKRAHMSVGSISIYQPIKVNRVLEVKNVVLS